MIRIRPATLADRAAIHAVHAASIRELCSTHYSSDEVERWAGFLTPERYTAVISDVGRHVVVAEIGGRIVGFGQAHLEAAEIEAMYVHPEHARAGIGSAIMRHFEHLAVQASLPSLHLSATLNAVPFYERQGFRVTGQGQLRHPSGITLPCISMVKTVGEPPGSFRPTSGRKPA